MARKSQRGYVGKERPDLCDRSFLEFRDVLSSLPGEESGRNGGNVSEP